MSTTFGAAPNHRKLRARLAVVAAVVALAGACGDDGSTESQPSPTTEAAVPEFEGDPGTCENLEPCDAVISASAGLADGDVVDVRVGGWGPDVVVGIAQCADEADPDNPQGVERGPDRLPGGEICNVLDLPGPARSETADGDGVVAFEYEVLGGNRMVESSAAGVTCDAEHDCVLNLFLSGANRFSAAAPIVTFPLRFG
ncbi:MAG: hypothetical protein AAGK32_16490 [Actinomycetota bacterium]